MIASASASRRVPPSLFGARARTAGIAAVASALCFAVAWTNQLYFGAVNGIVDAGDALARALLFSSWLVILSVPIVARRPAAYGWRLGEFHRHIPLIATTLAVAAVATYAIIRAVGATPYRDASLLVEIGVVPVTEELAFRSLLLTTLVAVLSRIHPPARAVTLAIVIDGVAFGVGHLANATSLPLAFVVGQAIFASCLGAACAWLMIRTRSVYPAIALHAVVNAVVVLA